MDADGSREKKKQKLAADVQEWTAIGLNKKSSSPKRLCTA